MSAIQITFKSGSQGGGSSGSGTPIQSADFANPAAALANESGSAGVLNGFLLVPNPVGTSGALGYPAAYNLDEIASIVEISAVTFGTVPGD